MPDDPQRTADYETLRKCAERGIGRYMPEGSDKDYSVHQLLGLVQPKNRDELVELAKKVDPHGEGKKSLAELLTDILEPKVTILGITFNLQWWFERLLDREKKKRNKKR
jgi:hypothetical protein